MAFTLYNPKTKTFSTRDTPSDGSLPFSEILLLNILIELQVLTFLMQEGSGVTPSPLESLRADIAAST